MDEAQDELTRIWYRSNRKQLISEAADAIDQELKTDAQLKGTRKGMDRVLSIRPLAVLYHVSLEDRLVRVLSIAEETN
jgi:hypothetical protein